MLQLYGWEPEFVSANVAVALTAEDTDGSRFHSSGLLFDIVTLTVTGATSAIDTMVDALPEPPLLSVTVMLTGYRPPCA